MHEWVSHSEGNMNGKYTYENIFNLISNWENTILNHKNTISYPEEL